MLALERFAPVPPMDISSLPNSLAVVSLLPDVASGPPLGRRKGAGQMPVTSGWEVAVPVISNMPPMTVLLVSADTLAVQPELVSARAAHQL